MNMNESGSRLLSRRQLAVMGWVALLSPLIRQVPGSVAPLAGRASWLCGALALPPVLLLGLLLDRLLHRAGEGEGLAELFLRALGPTAGRGALLLYALWLLFYTGCALRSGADRFSSAVFPGSRYAVFLLVMAILCAMAALGPLKVLSRCAQVAAPVLLAVLVLALLGTLPRVDWGELLPLRRADLPGALKGALPVADTLGVAAYLGFLAGETERGSVLRTILRPLAILLPVITLLCVTAVGTFGAGLTGRMNYPFFVMVRDVRVFRLLERVEALVIAQWVSTDFVFLSLLLHVSVRLLRAIFPGTGRRPLTLLCVLCAVAAAFLCAPTAFSLTWLRQTVMPLGNAVLLYAGIPLLWVAERLRCGRAAPRKDAGPR